MPAKIENLSITLELIRANPQAAEREAKNWQEFVLKLSSAYPELQIIGSQEEFTAWANSHPQLNIDRNIFKGKEIIEAYFYIKEQQEVQNTTPPPKEIIPTLDALNVMSFPVLALIVKDRPRVLEADSDYQKILTSKKNEWQTKNNAKDIYQSEEGLNYLYGDPNDPDKKTIDDEVEEKFRELAKTNKGMAKRLERYDLEKEKIYKDPAKDPSMLHLSAKINEEKQNRFLLLKKQNKKLPEDDYKKLNTQIEEKHYLNYAQKYQKKALAYSLSDEKIKKALEKIPKKDLFDNQEEKKEEEEKKENQISPNQARRIAEEFKKTSEPPQSIPRSETRISSLRKPIPTRTSPVSSSPISKKPTFRIPTPRLNFGGLGKGAGQGLGRAGGVLGKGGSKIAARGGMWAAGALAGIGWPVIIGIAAVLLVTIIIVIIGGGIAEIPSQEGGPGGDISRCTFYRGGDKEPGLQFGNPQMAALVSEISGKVGVPSSVVAGIMRVETPSAVSSTDTSYLTNDYDMHCSIEGWNEKRSPTIEECNQRGIAFGVMQFTPNTFLGTYQVNKVDLKSIFGKIDLKTTLDPQENMAPQNIFRIYSIKDSITAAAYKIKNDKYYINKEGQWDQETLAKIAARYYGVNKDGTTNYPGQDGSTQNYGNDLWKSFQNCQPASINPNINPQDQSGVVSCPLLGGKRIIGCGSFMSEERFNRLACQGPLPIDRGHCGRTYDPKGIYCYKGDIETTKLQRWAQAIDIDAPAGETVFAPQINNQNVKWNYVENSSYSVPDSVGGGWGHAFVSTVGTDKWTMYTVHMNYQIIPSSKGYYDSGDPITTVARTDYTHLHLNLGKQSGDSNIVWLPPEGLGTCVN